MKKLTLSIPDHFYNALYAAAGKRNISNFLLEKFYPLISDAYLEAGYKAMAEDQKQEKEAHEWSEAAIADMKFEPDDYS